MTHDALVAAAQSVLEATGAEAIDPAYILPADIPLELSGEAVRARLCVFTDHRGNEMAMRPDLTLSVGQHEAGRRSNGGSGSKAYTYAARAFRLAVTPADPTEFTQVGFETFGGASDPATDADAFNLVQAAVVACGIQPESIIMGDLSIFPAMVDALYIPRFTADLLKRAFRQEGGVADLLAAKPEHLQSDLQNILSNAHPPETFRALLAERGIPMIGTRSVAEIIDGLCAKYDAALAGGVPDEAKAALEAFFAIDCAASEAPDALAQLAKTHEVSGLDGAIARVADRVSKIDAPNARFRSGFGRRFTYYDGFVFEIFGKGLTARQPIAAGGRYDRLIGDLSGGRAEASGIGGVVRPDRILKSKGAR